MTEKGELIKKVMEVTEGDILEIFGKSGSGKTTFALEVCKDALSEGLKVAYIDTERNLTQSMIENLLKDENFKYGYAPSLSDMERMVSYVQKERFDLVILDSLGLPVLGEFARMNAKQRGDALLRLEALLYQLKQYAHKNNATILITNQPESEYLKPEGHELRPFGDKGMFFVKSIIKTYLVNSSAYLTECEFKAWRMRQYGRGRKILTMKIYEEEGVKDIIIEWHI